MNRSVRRRHAEIALGTLWLLDGVLQLQPFMFTPQFFGGILGMANMGLPGPVSDIDYRIATMLVAHPAVWNSVFASLQVCLGVGLLWRRTARGALIASIPWALGVWMIGEGFGGMFMEGTSLLTGAPGAALLYAIVAVLLLPKVPDRAREHAGRAAWAAVWVGSALLELQAVNHAPTVPGAQIVNGGYGEPGWLAWLNRSAGHLVGNSGAALAAAIATLAVMSGSGVYSRRYRKPALALGILLAALVGLLGQDIGGIATGRGTDPGTGPLLVLMALALWPRHATADATPASAAAHQPTSVRMVRPAAACAPRWHAPRARPRERGTLIAQELEGW